MNYEINLRVEKSFIESPSNYQGSRIATGWIEVESAIKFPVNVLRTKDNKRMFVKYPNTQNNEGRYTNVVFPVQEGLREELDAAVIAEVHNELRRGLENPDISSIKIHVLPEDIKSGKISIKGYASVVISGIVINGITIKEGLKGLFIQMPQSRDESGHYHDICYGTNETMRIKLENEILDAYEEKLKVNREQSVRQPIERKPEVSPKL